MSLLDDLLPGMPGNVGDILQSGGPNGSASWLPRRTFVHSDLLFSVDPDTGRIGIGTNSPEAHIHGIVEGANLGLVLECRSNTPTHSSYFGFRRALGTSEQLLPVLSGTVLAQVTVNGYTGAAYEGFRNFLIATATQDWTDAAAGFNLQIKTRANASVGPCTTAIFIGQDQKVGFGMSTAPTNGVVEVTGQFYCSADVSALTFTDRTPFLEGPVSNLLRGVSGKGKDIDHSTIPEFARSRKIVKKWRDPEDESKGFDEMVEEGRNLGAMITLLTKGWQELDARIDLLEKNKKEP